MVAKDELEPIRGTHPQWNIPHLCKGESRARLRTIRKKQPAERVIQRKETRTFTNVRFVPSEGHSPQWTRPRGSSPISSTLNSSRMQNTECRCRSRFPFAFGIPYLIFDIDFIAPPLTHKKVTQGLFFTVFQHVFVLACGTLFVEPYLLHA